MVSTRPARAALEQRTARSAPGATAPSSSASGPRTSARQQRRPAMQPVDLQVVAVEALGPEVILVGSLPGRGAPEIAARMGRRIHRPDRHATSASDRSAGDPPVRSRDHARRSRGRRSPEERSSDHAASTCSAGQADHRAWPISGRCPARRATMPAGGIDALDRAGAPPTSRSCRRAASTPSCSATRATGPTCCRPRPKGWPP